MIDWRDVLVSAEYPGVERFEKNEAVAAKLLKKKKQEQENLSAYMAWIDLPGFKEYSRLKEESG